MSSSAEISSQAFRTYTFLSVVKGAAAVLEQLPSDALGPEMGPEVLAGIRSLHASASLPDIRKGAVCTSDEYTKRRMTANKVATLGDDPALAESALVLPLLEGETRVRVPFSALGATPSRKELVGELLGVTNPPAAHEQHDTLFAGFKPDEPFLAGIDPRHPAGVSHLTWRYSLAKDSVEYVSRPLIVLNTGKLNSLGYTSSELAFINALTQAVDIQTAREATPGEADFPYAYFGRLLLRGFFVEARCRELLLGTMDPSGGDEDAKHVALVAKTEALRQASATEDDPFKLNEEILGYLIAKTGVVASHNLPVERVIPRPKRNRRRTATPHTASGTGRTVEDSPAVG